MRLMTHLVFVTVVLCACATGAAAQSTFGTVVGTVMDSTGGVLPGVTVVVRNTRTGVERVVASDAGGDYQAANLDAGPYTVSFSIAGFGERALQTEVRARQTVRVDVRLVVAGTSERIDVRAAAPVIEAERATIDASKSGDEINTLALNFRATNNTSPIVVATLAEGVQQDRGGQISVAGNLPFMTSFSVDGISTQRTRGGGPSRELFPSVESIEEFKVSSANNNAEFMQVTDITTTTKSGSNQLRGTGFWFYQDSKFSSVDRFAPLDASGSPIKPKVQANSFGASSGGPIAKNRTFFFLTCIAGIPTSATSRSPGATVSSARSSTRCRSAARARSRRSSARASICWSADGTRRASHSCSQARSSRRSSAMRIRRAPARRCAASRRRSVPIAQATATSPIRRRICISTVRRSCGPRTTSGASATAPSARSSDRARESSR